MENYTILCEISPPHKANMAPGGSFMHGNATQRTSGGQIPAQSNEIAEPQEDGQINPYVASVVVAG
jgi:hypothetical protein